MAIPHMSSQPKLFCCTKWAELTSMRLLTTVGEEMPPQVVRVGGAKGTLGTSEGFLFGMYTDMLLDTGGVIGGIRTIRAMVLLPVSEKGPRSLHQASTVQPYL